VTRPSPAAVRAALATAGVALGTLVFALDGTIVGTAMPRIVAELHGLDRYAWVTTAYLVTSTVVIPIAGKLGDMFGRKHLVLLGMVGFMATSWLAGASRDVIELVLCRGLQGGFGGCLFAVAFTILADVYPDTVRRAKVMGPYAAVIYVATIVAPALGGFITDNWGWRWIFYLNVPVGVPGVALVLAFLPLRRSAARLRDVDFLGCAAVAAGLTPLLVALSIAGAHAWTSPEVVGLLSLSSVLLAAFVLVERRAAEPVVSLELFRHRAFAVPVAIAAFSAVGLYAAVLFVPLLYQGVLGATATSSGALLVPMSVASAVTGVAYGQVMVRMRRYRFVATASMAAMTAGMALLALVTPGSGRWEVTRDIVILGLGAGPLWGFSALVAQAALPAAVVGMATAQINFWRNLGGTIGVVVLGSILNRQIVLRLGLADALHMVFLLCAAVLLVPLAASLLLREVPLRAERRDAAAHGLKATNHEISSRPNR
jgi:EmrB/QacA subfamily drug resistance transporter